MGRFHFFINRVLLVIFAGTKLTISPMEFRGFNYTKMASLPYYIVFKPLHATQTIT